MSDIEAPRSPSSPDRAGAQSKRRRLRDGPDRVSRYSSPDELGEDERRNASSRRSRLTSRGPSTQRRDSGDEDEEMEDERRRSESADELGHTIAHSRRDDEDNLKNTEEDSSSRSRTTPTPEEGDEEGDEEEDEVDDEVDDEEDEDDGKVADTPEEATPQKKPFRYKLKYSFLAHSKGIAQTKFSPDGEYIASCSGDSTAKIWLASTGQLVHVLDGHLAGISALSWSPDSLTIATGSDDKTIRIWDIVTGQQVQRPWTGHSNYVFSVAFSPKGNMLASGSYDEALFIWDVRGARQMRSLPAHSDPIGSVDFTPDGTLVASCATDGLIRVWDTGSGQCLRTIVHEDNAKVASLKFSPNGKYIAAWTVDNCIRLWDFVTGQCKKTYQGHVNAKFSASGAFGVWEGEAFLVSPSEDGRIVFWDVKSKEVLQDLKGHGDVVMCVDTDATSSRIVSCDKAGYIKLWEPASDSDVEDILTNGLENVNLLNGDDDDAMDEDADEGSNASGAEEEDDGMLETLVDDDGHPLRTPVTLIPAPSRIRRERRLPPASAINENPPPEQQWKLPRQGPPDAEQSRFSSGMGLGTFDGADERPLQRAGEEDSPEGGEEEVDVKIEDLMQEVVDEIMSDSAGPEDQIKSEMDARV